MSNQPVSKSSVIISSAERFTVLASQQEPLLGFYVIQLSIPEDGLAVQVMLNLGEDDAVSETLVPGGSLVVMAKRVNVRLFSEPTIGDSKSTILEYSVLGYERI